MQGGAPRTLSGNHTHKRTVSRECYPRRDIPFLTRIARITHIREKTNLFQHGEIGTGYDRRGLAPTSGRRRRSLRRRNDPKALGKGDDDETFNREVILYGKSKSVGEIKANHHNAAEDITCHPITITMMNERRRLKGGNCYQGNYNTKSKTLVESQNYCQTRHSRQTA